MTVTNKMARSKTFWVIFALCVIAVAVGIWFSWPRIKAPTTTRSDSSSLKATVLNKASGEFTFPTAQSSNDISIAALPTYLRLLILPSASGISVRALAYPASSAGYEITYTHPSSTSAVFAALVQQLARNKFGLPESAVTPAFGYLDFSWQQNVKGRIEIVPSGSVTSITIRTLQPVK